MLLSGETRYVTMLPEKITTIFWMGFSLYLGTVRHFFMWIFIRVYLPASKINYKNIAKNNRKILSESKFDKSNPLCHYD